MVLGDQACLEEILSELKTSFEDEFDYLVTIIGPRIPMINQLLYKHVYINLSLEE